MKIKKLKITNYKNLDAELEHDSDIIALIGNNGSGKSNMLEAISHIFRSLYAPNYRIDFDYVIEYVTSNGRTVKIEKTGRRRNDYVDGKLFINVADVLPQKLVAIYSGEEKRLYEDCYQPVYQEFISRINRAQIQKTDYSNLPKMIFLNKDYWHLSLLSLLLSNDDGNKKFLKEVLQIETIDKIRIEFNRGNYDNYNDNLALKFVQDIDSKEEYTLEELKELVTEKGYIIDDVYKYLYLSFTPDDKKIIKDVIIKFNGNLTITDLSEGEKKMLLIKAALEYAAQEDSVFVLDEPDAHVHLNNKEQIIKCFKDYKENRQIIITTHSPTLTQAVADENVYMMNKGKIENKSRQQIIEDITGEFWNKHQQSTFLSAKKNIILLVEGKHDKEHINNAYEIFKDQYSDLNFEMFKLNTESNIQPFLRGLYESEFETSKLYIGLFDREQKILSDFKNPKNYSKIDGKSFFKIIENSTPNNNYFVTALPEIDKRTCDCSIEMMYDYPKFEEAYQKAVQNTIGKTVNKSIKEYSDEILNDAKNIMSENSKSFTKEDFKHFPKLFDLIREINEHYKGLQNPPAKPQNPPAPPQNPPSQSPNFPAPTLPVVVSPTPKTVATPLGNESASLVSQINEEHFSKFTPILGKVIEKKLTPAKTHHFAYWTAFNKYVAQNNYSFQPQSPHALQWHFISIGNANFRIAVLNHTTKHWICVQLIFDGDFAQENFLNFQKRFESDSKIELDQKIEWRLGDKKRSFVNYTIFDKDPLDKADWESQHKLLADWVAKFIVYFRPKIMEL